ncbi:tyrosine-type recombinase/integrase [Natronomonas amylolytica]|uniref:tyrosine-type recombinase/integrase n=1 Tax=Natronomonas amylolytica TaxID=3108498 RepID=UPI00300BB14E
MPTDELEPIDPETALEMYLSAREREIAQSTLRAHRSRLGHFLRWCDEQDIDNLNVLTGRDIHEYRLWRRNEGDLSTSTEKTQMDTVRVFVRWLGTIDAVDGDLHAKVQSPTLTGGDNVRDVRVEADEAASILEYYSTYEYASLSHVTIALLWQTMMRRSAIRALDVDDYDSDEQYLHVEHRPETDTPVKNGEDGERYIALRDDTCSLLDDWLANQRPDVTDEYGREPLLATSQGRPHVNTIQKYVYGVTRPCIRGDGCPHDRSPEDCDAAQAVNRAYDCPSSVSPHAVRRGSITNHLNTEMPEEVVSDRADVTKRVLELHYDRRSEQEKMEQRREYL